MERNLTNGSIWGNIVSFSLPYLLSYFLQTLYGMADLYIVGQFNGTHQITEVSVGSQVMHMLTVMIVGLAMGTTVSIARAVGAGEGRRTSTIVGSTITLFMAVAVAAMALLLVCVNPIVALMSTPEAAVAGTRQYLTICFVGIPFITAYSIISSIFRGLGDSKSPMYFIAVACGANIALDYLFIGVLGMGAAGAALGTVLSQTISVLIALATIRRRRSGLRLEKSDLRLQGAVLRPILRVGVPVALQDGFIQITFIVITIIANRRGLNDAAAVGIVEKVIGMLFLVPSSMLSTVSAISAQNIGAGKHERAAKTLRCAIVICVLFGAAVVLLVQNSAESIVALFDKSPAVVLAGGQYFRGYVWDCIFAGIHFCFSGYFCAYGRSDISFVHNMISIVLVRIPGSYLMSALFVSTLLPMGFAAPAGSLLSVLICLIAFGWLRRHKLG
ncbi:MAG: MATE family efflux transporter [Clostridiales bacterium]|nr:MATE family efflux transporter [Clostridiales bacterium]MDY4035776.1 MATE family efflux transporter [Candidatus Pseudoscilispira sp.]